MRTKSQETKIQETKENSRKSPLSQDLILLTGKHRREFFKFQSGETIEYDLTRCNGRNIILSEVEKRACEEFFISR